MFSPLYAPSPLGTALFALLFFGWALFELVVNLRLWSPGSVNRDGWTRFGIIGGMLLAFALSVAATRVTALNFQAGRLLLFWLGLGLMVGGLVFRAWAIGQLGRYFVPEVAIQPGQRVLDRGLYRYLRHPSYTGTFITVIGYALALNNWLSVVIMLVITGVVYGWRMRVEEAALTEAFGEEYRAYMRRTKRLVPFVL